MRLEWMFLANYAEDNKGLLNVSGASWDTIEVRGPIALSGGAVPPVSSLPVAVFQGFLVARISFHASETGREYNVAVLVTRADGETVATAEGRSLIDRLKDLPTGWPQGVNLVIPLSGIPLPEFAHYSIVLRVDDQYLGDIAFRVVKKY